MYAIYSLRTRTVVATGDTLEAAYRSVPAENKRDAFNIVDGKEHLEQEKKKIQAEKRNNLSGFMNMDLFAKNNGETERISPAYSGYVTGFGK